MVAAKRWKSENAVGETDMACLWEAYRVSRDEHLRNRLLIHYMRLSNTIARHMHNRMPASVELDDLCQAALLGMRAAIATYDPKRGVPFEKFCGPRVRGAVLDHLRSLDWAPRMLRSRVHRVQEMVRQIEASTGIAPTDEQLSDALDMPMEELHVIRDERVLPPARLALTTGNGSETSGGLNLELLADAHSDMPWREAVKADLRVFLTRGLSAIDCHVLVMYYYEQMSLREIGETLNLCESRVSQIHQMVLKRLRERMDRIGGSSIDD